MLLLRMGMKKLVWSLLMGLPFLGWGQPSIQHAIGVQWELPLQYGVRYDFRPVKLLSAHLGVGLLSEPNSTAIFNTLEAFGTDKETLNLLDKALQTGLVLESGLNLHFGKNYSGLYLQVVRLSGKDTAYDIVEQTLNEDLTTYPSRRGISVVDERTLTLNSNLLQLGWLYGRIFPLKGRSQLFAELSVSLNLDSRSNFDSNQRDFSGLDQVVDAYLSDVYRSYAYLPGLTLGWRKLL